jgi:hypothetical protein
VIELLDIEELARTAARAIARAIVLLTVLSGTIASAGQGSPATPVVELRPGVLIDRTRGAIYTGLPAGGVDSLDLQTGRSRWSSPDADLPLALRDRTLVAQNEETRPGAGLPIVALDVEQNGRRLWSLTAPLPPGVIALVTDTLHRSFRSTARVEGNHVVVSWTYRGAPVQGVARTPGRPLDELTLSGAVRIELSTGRVLDTQETPGPPAPTVTGLPAQLMESNGLPQPPSRAGNVYAAAVGGRRAPVILKRWNAASGAALPDVVLVKDGVVAIPSSDARHVLASERVGKGGPDDPEYRWSVFSQESGLRLAQLRRDVSAAPFFVSDRSVILESPPHGFLQGNTWVARPLEIIAVSLTNGNSIWSHAIRDLEFRGVAPPK